MSLRKVSHQEATKEVNKRGYPIDWNEEIKYDIDNLGVYLDSSDSTATILDALVIEDLVATGMFKNKDHPNFAKVLEYDALVGQMLYYMISVTDVTYSYEDLVRDIEEISKKPFYKNACFSRDE